MLCGGATAPRDLQIPGRELAGIHFAVDYLTQQNRRCEGDDLGDEALISAEGRRVVIIGGGDTGADCLGTAHRQGARVGRTVRAAAAAARHARREQSLAAVAARLPHAPPRTRKAGNRLYSVSTERFVGDERGRVSALQARQVEMRLDAGGRARFEPVPGTGFEIPADLVLLAMGFVGPERGSLLAELGVRMTDRGTVWRDENWMTSEDAVFTAGDMQRGQSLIVWAIADGRSAAHGVDAYLMGTSTLPLLANA